MTEPNRLQAFLHARPTAATFAADTTHPVVHRSDATSTTCAAAADTNTSTPHNDAATALQHVLGHLETTYANLARTLTDAKQASTDKLDEVLQYIATEKKADLDRFTKLQKRYDKLHADCADLKRYNTLLQEKQEQMEADRKAMTKVSMLTKWERRLNDAKRESEQAQARADKAVARAETLRQENVMLNAQVERLMLHVDEDEPTTTRSTVAHVSAAPDVPESKANVENDTQNNAVLAPVYAAAAQSVAYAATTDAHVAATNAQTATTHAAVHAAHVSATRSATCADTCATSAAQGVANTVAATVAQHAATAADTCAATAADVSAMVTDTCAATVADVSATVADVAPASCDDVAKKETECVDVEKGAGVVVEEPDVETPVTYTVKLLKRGRGATEKTKFLLGSDDQLYACLEGEVAGAVVGERVLTAEGKKRGFRFFKGV